MLLGDWGYDNFTDLPVWKEINLDLAYRNNDAEAWLYKMSANLRSKKSQVERNTLNHEQILRRLKVNIW